MEENNFDISPKYLMELIEKIQTTLWKTFRESKYKNVMHYIQKWHEEYYNGECNFNIFTQDNSSYIDLERTLHSIEDRELIVKIAIDLGIETPDFIPCISTFKNTLKGDYKYALRSFKKALKEIEEHPENAITLANSTLESIIKHIMEDEALSTKLDKKKSLYKLSIDILKEFKLSNKNEKALTEIQGIGTGLLNASQNIETLRSKYSAAHGNAKNDFIIEDPLYAHFIVNTVSTIGLFLVSFYKKKYNKKTTSEKNSIPTLNYESEIKPEDLPF